jgi:hypothetical protein
MTSPETYTALLRDNAFGPVVKRLDDQQLVDRRPDPVIRRFVEREGQRWVKVYDLDSAERDGHTYTYLLSYEGPEPLAEDGSTA